MDVPSGCTPVELYAKSRDGGLALMGSTLSKEVPASVSLFAMTCSSLRCSLLETMQGLMRLVPKLHYELGPGLLLLFRAQVADKEQGTGWKKVRYRAITIPASAPKVPCNFNLLFLPLPKGHGKVTSPLPGPYQPSEAWGWRGLEQQKQQLQALGGGALGP